MAFIAALQKLFKDYETLLNDYKPISPLKTPPQKKYATKKRGNFEFKIQTLNEQTKKAAEIQPLIAAVVTVVNPPPADIITVVKEAAAAETAAKIQPPPVGAAAVVKEAVKAATVVKQLPTKTATVVELQQSADIISIKNAINNMKSSFPNKLLRGPLVNTNLNYGAPLNLKVKSPVQINHSRLMEEIELIHANKLMEERKLKKTYTLKEILKETQGAYGSDKFREVING